MNTHSYDEPFIVYCENIAIIHLSCDATLFLGYNAFYDVVDGKGSCVWAHDEGMDLSSDVCREHDFEG